MGTMKKLKTSNNERNSLHMVSRLDKDFTIGRDLMLNLYFITLLVTPWKDLIYFLPLTYYFSVQWLLIVSYCPFHEMEKRGSELDYER